MVYTVLLDLVSVSSNILSLICLYLFGAHTLASVSCSVSRILVALVRQVTGGVTECNIPGQHVKYCYSVAICCKKEALILLHPRLAIKPRNVPVVRFTSVRVKLQEKLPNAIVLKSCTR